MSPLYHINYLIVELSVLDVIQELQIHGTNKRRHCIWRPRARTAQDLDLSWDWLVVSEHLSKTYLQTYCRFRTNQQILNIMNIYMICLDHPMFLTKTLAPLFGGNQLLATRKNYMAS